MKIIFYFCMVASIALPIFSCETDKNFLPEMAFDQINDDTRIIWENGHNGWGTYAIAQTADGKKYFLSEKEFDIYIKNRTK